MSTDRIEKKILLRAPLARVWRALADPGEFASWFGMKFEGAFAPGARLKGTIVGTSVDAELAKAQRSHAGAPFEITIEEVVPERLLSLRWHPAAIEPGVDYSAESTTLVEFRLDETAEGVMLTVSESGFDQIPLARRAAAFGANEQGWGIMVNIFGKYIAQTP